MFRQMLISNLHNFLTAIDQAERTHLNIHPLKQLFQQLSHKHQIANGEPITIEECFEVTEAILTTFGDRIDDLRLQDLFIDLLSNPKDYFAQYIPIHRAGLFNQDRFTRINAYHQNVTSIVIQKLAAYHLINAIVLDIIFDDEPTSIKEKCWRNQPLIILHAEAFQILQESQALTFRQMLQLKSQPILCGYLVDLVHVLANDHLISPALNHHICRHLTQLPQMLDLAAELKNLDPINPALYYNEHCLMAAFQTAKHAAQIKNCLYLFQKANILTPAIFINICEWSAQSSQFFNFIAALYQENAAKNLLTVSNIAELPRLFPHENATLAALRALDTAGNLTQAVFNEILATPQQALLIAQRRGGAIYYDDTGAIEAFDELRKNSQVLAQCMRTGTSFFQFLPLEIKFQIMRETIPPHTLDHQTLTTTMAVAINEPKTSLKKLQ